MSLESPEPRDRAEINRENSRKSTGPKTHAGKHRSSLNALRHGLTGQVVVLPGEDLAAYERLAKGFHDHFKPVGALEIQLVQSYSDDSWRLDRSKAMENNVYALGLIDQADSINTRNHQVHDALAVAKSLSKHTQELTMLSLHQNRISRAMDRTLRQLRELQAERRRQEQQDRLDAASITKSMAANKQVYDPTEDGFVFSTEDLARWTRRNDRIEAARQGHPKAKMVSSF